MLSTDPIADMLTRIRNAIAISRGEVAIPFSKMKLTIATELKKAGYVDEVKEEGEANLKTLKITINQPGSSPRINEIARVSKPGRRVYSKADKVPIVKNGRGVVLISTSKGVMTGAAASKANLGGEVICRVY